MGKTTDMDKPPLIMRLVTTGGLHLAYEDEASLVHSTLCGLDARRAVPETSTDEATELQINNLCGNCVNRWGERKK